MSLFKVIGIVLLFVGGLICSPMSANAAEQYQINALVTDAALVSTSSIDSASEAPVSSSLLQSSKEQLLHKQLQINLPANELGHSGSGDSEYVPLVSQRFINFAQHERLHSRPDYQLVFEFISPAIPALTVGYRMDSPPAVDWQLHIVGTSFRLSGWKESNHLYRLSHTRSA